VKSISCSILIRFSKLSFGSASSLTSTPYIEYAVKDHNQVSQTIFWISRYSRMCNISRLYNENKNRIQEMENNYIQWEIHKELRIHYAQSRE